MTFTVVHDREEEVPTHYDLGDGRQVWDVLEKINTPTEYRAYHRDSALKYLLRCHAKGKYDEDMVKALNHLRRWDYWNKNRGK